MSVTNFIGEIWSAKLMEALQKAHVYASITNQDYIGEIKNAGDTVRINSIGDVGVYDYVPNSTTITPEKLTQAQTVLTIGQMKYFAFSVDDVDNAQVHTPVMQGAMRSAAFKVNDGIDTYIASKWGDAGIVLNEVALNSVNVLATFVLMQQKMDEANIPAEGRWTIIPPWMEAKMILAKIYTGTNNDQDIINGRIGRFMGFDVYKSNNVPIVSTSKYKILSGTRSAICFAEQIVQIEAFRPESSFSDAVKGLHVYDGKVIRPDQLMCLTVTNAAEPS